jgi:group I intron endonuclease
MNLINGKIYIGQTIDLQFRWKRHLKTSDNPTSKNYQLIHKAINKYGKENFIFTPIQTFFNYKEVLNAEKYWISFYKTNVGKHSNKFGYNLTDGGEGLFGYTMSKKHKQNLSKARFGLKVNPKFNLIRSIATTGAGNPIYGKHHTNDAIKKISTTRKSKRIARGSNNPKAKLNENQVIEIKLLLKEGKLQQKEIALIYNVWPTAIQKIASGVNWKHIIV